MTQDKKDDYRDTVFLPKTDFPMRGGLAKKEPEIMAGWDEIDLYAQLRKKGEGQKKFILHDGPPYANGNIHMGHAVNKILKDVIVRSHTMDGKDAPYVPGWDCHGLPIEWKIEEKYRNAGKDKDDVDILEFREECRQFAREWVDIQSKQFQRLGVSGDWANPYLTLTNRAESKIAREIHKFAANGSLYRGKKIVMWSVVEKTSLAEAEVEYKEHKSVTVWVKFPIKESGVVGLDKILAGKPASDGSNDEEKEIAGTTYPRNGAREGVPPASIVIWTTTPWTIPSNRAIALGEDIEYGVYTVKDIQEGSSAVKGEKLVMAVSLAESVKESAKIEAWEEDVYFLKGSLLFGTTCKHPLADLDEYYKYDVPVLAGDFVTDEAGTGFVHIAPDHGEDDFNLVQIHNAVANTEWEGVQGMKPPENNEIEITDNVTDDGKFREHVGLFAGLEIYTQKGKLGDGNFAVLRELTNAGKLLGKKTIKHDYPHSWRSKAPIIFRSASPQWFIAMDGVEKIREKALQAIKDTNWYPAKGETRINAMIESRPDWCISRQRAWGVPIALFLNKDTNEVLIDEDIFTRITEAFEAEGADAWWKDGAAQRFLGDKYNADDYTQIFDIVDVWFESGSTHKFVVGDTQTWPCFEGVDKIDLYLEGSDQHRGWFHSSLLESCGTTGHTPYKNVMTHGFVLDEKGYKMSKSVGNVVDPLKMMNQYGADIIRLWVMLSDYQEDIRIGKDTLKNTSDLYRRIRNTLRFLLGALEGFDNDERIERSEYKDMPELERYMLHNLAEMDEFVRDAIKNYEFGKLAKRLHDFCNQELSAFYFDIRKDRLYCDRTDMFERRACRTVMAEIFDCLSAWLAPILCFTAEEAWSHRPKGAFNDAKSVHLRDYPAVPAEWKDDDLFNRWKEIILIRKQVQEFIEPIRAKKELGSSLEAKPTVKTPLKTVLSLSNEEFADICITSQILIERGDPSIIVQKAQGSKCDRCWKVLPEVSAETQLCNRCTNAVDAHKSNSKAA
ncbi:MAG: isoleucine--tRNA ligase [Alphaproteobacteria bacterium]|nr:MAG: isoleucine--tRNA ligase [Alphaproteobacteria bacterium]